MNLSLLIIGGTCFVRIFLNTEDLFDFNQRISYSLGVLGYDAYQTVSQMIGIFALSLTAFTISKKRAAPVYLLSFAIVATCLYTITLSPARGEAIALVLALFILVFSASNWSALLLAMIGAFIASSSFLDTTLGNRLAEFTTGYYGERDILFSLAWSQFFGSLSTMVIGTGFNGFQSFNMLPAELYPHNFLLEGAISGGIFLFALLMLTYVVPIVRMILKRDRTPEESLSLCLMVFFILIYMKSGTLNSFWGLGAYTALFIRSPASSGPVAKAYLRSGQTTR